jgi:hypothetical protein
MPLSWTISGPANLPGKLYVAALGSAANFGPGLGINPSGLILSNPLTLAGQPQVRIVPLRLSMCAIGTSGTGGPYLTAGPIAIGIVKGIGTCTAGAFSGFSGMVTSKGIIGTSTSQVAVVAGTCSWLNGTSGPGPNSPNWIQMLGVVQSTYGSFGTATGGGIIPGHETIFDLQSEEGIMPGETLVISTSIQVAGLASIAWVEVPATSGA